MISSVLTARGVPGGTAARTFVDAYLDPGSKRRRNGFFFWFIFQIRFGFFFVFYIRKVIKHNACCIAFTYTNTNKDMKINGIKGN